MVEVGDFEIACVVEEQILQSEVSVHDIALVEVLDAQDELNEVKLDLLLSKLSRTFEDQVKLTTSHKRIYKIEPHI